METDQLNAGDTPSQVFVMKMPHDLDADKNEDVILQMNDRAQEVGTACVEARERRCGSTRRETERCRVRWRGSVLPTL